jgi:hypothetical protein
MIGASQNDGDVRDLIQVGGRDLLDGWQAAM